MMTEMTGVWISVTSPPLRIKRSPVDSMDGRVRLIGCAGGINRRLRHRVPDPYGQFRPLDCARDVVHIDVTAELPRVFLRNFPGTVPGCEEDFISTGRPCGVNRPVRSARRRFVSLRLASITLMRGHRCWHGLISDIPGSSPD